MSLHGLGWAVGSTTASTVLSKSPSSAQWEPSLVMLPRTLRGVGLSTWLMPRSSYRVAAKRTIWINSSIVLPLVFITFQGYPLLFPCLLPLLPHRLRCRLLHLHICNSMPAASSQILHHLLWELGISSSTRPHHHNQRRPTRISGMGGWFLWGDPFYTIYNSYKHDYGGTLRGGDKQNNIFPGEGLYFR